MTDATAPQDAVIVVVTGAKLQKVGFRAMIQKMAIMFNLAGSARNNSDGTVEVNLQGNAERIDEVIAAIRAGSKKSSQGNTIVEVPTEWDSDLSTFTVFGWTSTSRQITNPYDLVYTLRPLDEPTISHHEAKAIWNDIAKRTLQGEDVAKLMAHLGEED